MVAFQYALSFVALLIGAAKAATYRPETMLIMNGLPNAIYTYAYSNGSLIELSSPATTANASGANTCSLSALAQRLFYQTANGNIMSAYHSGLTGSAAWVVDTTIATGIPLGSPITAVIAVQQSTRQQVAIVQYTDPNGLLNSRFSALDQGGWSTPIIVTT
ncbi:hypothetical protein R3P38DRAFT_3175506 [Favolaschia claudopus]|uniref:Fucose-specific lectin n=1 Tax=Favolaschia claudopus TaxID=2862362 RepID=A0AAW0D5F1_9AGAR